MGVDEIIKQQTERISEIEGRLNELGSSSADQLERHNLLMEKLTLELSIKTLDFIKKFNLSDDSLSKYVDEIVGLLQSRKNGIEQQQREFEQSKLPPSKADLPLFEALERDLNTITTALEFAEQAKGALDNGGLLAIHILQVTIPVIQQAIAEAAEAREQAKAAAGKAAAKQAAGKQGAGEQAVAEKRRGDNVENEQFIAADADVPNNQANQPTEPPVGAVPGNPKDDEKEDEQPLAPAVAPSTATEPIQTAPVVPEGLPTPTPADLSKLGAEAGKGELTKAGHSLSKHAAGKRQGSSAFPDAKGKPAEINQQAQKILDDILNDPAKVVKQRPGRPGDQLLQVHRPDGSGVIFKWDGTRWVFSHFAEKLF